MSTEAASKKMRDMFEKNTPGAERFIYVDGLDVYICKSSSLPMFKRKELEAAFSINWINWKIAYQAGVDSHKENPSE